MADKFHGDLDQLQAAVASCGVGGSWRTEANGSHRFDGTNEGILLWWPNTGTLSFQGREAGRTGLKEAILAALAGDAKSKALVRVAHSE